MHMYISLLSSKMEGLNIRICGKDEYCIKKEKGGLKYMYVSNNNNIFPSQTYFVRVHTSEFLEL